ncbi:protein-methionine-sulfoxide reductase heme-binding subunit MsrQ [uncultured Paraglaciecola sp.]|uniref:protein-methionine-sulfoxide reductase heme-binding subunit MsrQ n=1 Tax=uncultured Paraglaciecola sp. TaxID=1765024 RepID=UPI0026027065|nr:protein-methionine-sulfoxide reductase heme-binding subunit MsrQ [uncultured Paraglaciecola sp.]
MNKFVRLTLGQTFWLKMVLHVAALSLLSLTFYQAYSDQLGADPVEALLHFTGIGAFNLLLLSLLISPLAKYLRLGQLLTLRRPVGLYAFAYGLCHVTSYIMFELQFEWSLIFSEVVKRPYITVGFSALLILTLLATTSTKAIQRRMGKTWQKTHNWVYVASLLVALHYLWSVKSDLIQPIIYAVVLLTLLATRKDKFLKPFRSALNRRNKRQQNKKKLA